MSVVLQNILFPSQLTCESEECFYRKEEERIVFNTYFNFFSLAKWKKYTELKHISLHFRATGKYVIKLVAYDSDKNQRTLLEKGYDSEMIQGDTVDFDYLENDKFLWFEFIMQSEDAALVEASYVTNDKPINKPRIAIDICTFKREEYVHRNVGLLNQMVMENPDCDYKDNFRVYIVDNGKTLDLNDFNTDHVKVIPNINAGGSGGFTRGIIELLEDKKDKSDTDESYDYTHMIFMDDDAVLEPDSLIRTASFLSFLKTDYSKTVIGGSMNRLDFRYVQHEAGAIWNGVIPIRNHEGVDLRDFEQVCDNEQEVQADYAGWWFACYPLTVVREDNLPLPMFIHCDDMEYGLRNRENGIVFLNGVCVWHNSFEHRRTSSLSYHDIRNIMIMNAITYKDGNQKAWNKSMLKRVIGDLFRYRYKDVYLKCMGVEDFISGPDYYMHIDPIEKLKSVNEKGYKLSPVEEITTDNVTLADVDNFKFATEIDEMYPKTKVGNRKWKLLTMNGMLFPSKHEEHINAFPMGIDPYSLYRKKQIILFDPYNNNGVVLKRDNVEMLKTLIVYFKTMRKVNKQYSVLQMDYQSKIAKARTVEFWKEYLKINGSSN